MASNKGSDHEDDLDENLSKADIDKMIRFLHAHTDYKVIKGHEQKHSTPKVKLEDREEAPSRPPPPPPARSSSFLHTSAIRGHSYFSDMSDSLKVFQKPRFPNFSGEEKSEATFDVWKSEVKCVLREGNNSESVVLQSMRGSLKGKARSLLLSLPENVSPQQIIDKLEGVYGNVYTIEALLEKFYKEIQKPNQSVAEYGMVLESIIQPAVEKGDIGKEAKNEMLRSKFWSGLRDPLLKNSSRFKFETVKDFDQLRKEIRAIELELSNSEKSTVAVQHQPISSDSVKLDDIIKKIDRMGKRLDTIENKSTKDQDRGTGNTQFYRGNSGGFSRGYRGFPRRNGRGRGFQNFRNRGGFSNVSQNSKLPGDKMQKSEGNLNE